MISQFIDWAAAVYEEWGVVITVFAIVFATLVVAWLASVVLQRLARRSDPVRHVWIHGMLASASTPVQALVWVIGLAAAGMVLVRQGGDSTLSHVLVPGRNVAIILVVMWFLLRMVGNVQANLVARAGRRGRELDPTATDAVSKLAKASIVITAILTMMQTLGFSIAGVLAFGGVGGIAVGFAAQSLVANLLGGLTIFASRPFKVGEYIIIPGTELMGGVEHIGWRATRLIGFDRKPFYVPNAMFNTQPVINHSRMTSRQISETIHVRYDDIEAVQAIVTDGRAMLASHPGIQHDFFAFNFDSCGESSLKLFLYAFTVSTDYNDFMDVKEDVLLRLAGIIRGHGARLAVPVSTVYMPDGLQIRRRESHGGGLPPELAGSTA